MIIHATWQEMPLGDLVEFRTGKLNSNAATPDGQFPFFTCSRETYRTDTFCFDGEAVLLAGNNANGVYPIKYFNGKFDAYQRTYIITTKDSGLLDNRYFYFAMQPKLEMLQTLSTGAATKFLTLTILKGLAFELPPLPTQQRIASILSAYDDLIENNTRRIEILEEMARRLYEEWFIQFRFPGHEAAEFNEEDGQSLPRGWCRVGLYDVAEVTYGHPFKSKQFNTESEGLGVIRIRDIMADQASAYTLEEGKPHHKVEDGDILIGMDGAFYLGRWAGGEAWLNQRVVRLRPKAPMTRHLLFQLVAAPIKRLEETIVGTTVAHLSARDLKAMSIVLPDKRGLELAATHLEPVFDKLLNLKHTNANLRAQRDLLLPKLVSGEIDVGEAKKAMEAAE